MIPLPNTSATGHSVPSSHSQPTRSSWLGLIASQTAFVITVIALQSFHSKRSKNDFEKDLQKWCIEAKNDTEKDNRNKVATVIRSCFLDPSHLNRAKHASPGSGTRWISVDINRSYITKLPPMLEPDRVHKLDASYNIWENPPILTSFSSLKSLSLIRCSLKKAPNISGLLELIFVDLSDNELTQIPTTHNRSNINLNLVLSKNYITDLDEDLREKPNTHTIDLESNLLSDKAKLMIQDMKEKKEGPTITLLKTPLFA